MKKLLVSCLCVLQCSLSVYAEELISLNFNRAELLSALQIFEKTSQYQTVLPTKMSGTVTAKIDDLTPLKALDIIFRGQDYDYLLDGNTVLVYGKNDENLYQHTFALQHIRIEDVKSMIESLISKEKNETVAFSETLNTVSIKGVISSIKQIQRLLYSVDVPPKQVLMKAKILEIKRSNGDTDQSTTLGVDLDYTLDSNGSSVKTLSNGLAALAPTKGLYTKVVASDLSAYVNAIERTTDFELLASPWITAVNHHKAELLIGSKIGYKTTLATTTGTQENIEFMEVGIKLSFTPHISNDGYIRMLLQPSISDGKLIDGLPQENTTEATSDIIIKDGETLVIGGLTKTSDSQINTGIPLLSRLPLIGALFGKIETVKEKRDLMIIISPTIVDRTVKSELYESSVQFEDQILNLTKSKLQEKKEDQKKQEKERKKTKKSSKSKKH